MFELNLAAVDHARDLVNQGAYATDNLRTPRFPEPYELDAYIRQYGWEAYGMWFLAVDTALDEHSLQRYWLPIGDLCTVQHQALMHALKEAIRYDSFEVEFAAQQLLSLLDED